MNIRTKLMLLVVSLVALGGGVAGWIGFSAINSNAKNADLMSRGFTAIQHAQETQRHYNAANAVVDEVVAMVSLPDMQRIEKTFRTESELIGKCIAILKSVALSPEMTEQANLLEEAFKAWQSDAAIILGLQASGEVPTIELLNRHGDNMRSATSTMLSLAQSDAQRLTAAST